MEDMDDLYHKRKPRRTESEAVDVNFDDMCYARLRAVVEADSSRHALEKYLQDNPVQVTRDGNNGSRASPAAGDPCYQDANPPEKFNLNEYRVTRVQVKASYGSLRNFDSEYAQIQLTPYRVSTTKSGEKLVWVYQMGTHWVICC